MFTTRAAREESYKAEVRRTHALLKPIQVEAAAIFYPTLFEVDPSTKPLFKDVDMEKQGAKLMKVIGVAVMMLDKMDQFKPMLVKLGKKHVTYGVTDDMYPSVVSALLITLEKGLGEECHQLTKDAWAWVMNSIAAVCIAAAREDTGAPAGEKKLPIEKNTAAAAVAVAVAVAVGVLVLWK
ncbi:unnamed protein product [Ectocarpus sp. 6 AP-2014]